MTVPLTSHPPVQPRPRHAETEAEELDLADVLEQERSEHDHHDCCRTNVEIADELHISLSTVTTHLANLMMKLAARNRVELAIWAHETDRITT